MYAFCPKKRWKTSVQWILLRKQPCLAASIMKPSQKILHPFCKVLGREEPCLVRWATAIYLNELMTTSTLPSYQAPAKI